MPLRAMRNKAHLPRMPDDPHQKVKDPRPGTALGRRGLRRDPGPRRKSLHRRGARPESGERLGCCPALRGCPHRQELRSHPLNLAGHAR